MREKKNHLYLDSKERKLLLHSLVGLKNQLIQQGRYHLDVPWRPSDVGRILRTFKIKKNVEVTDNGKDDFWGTGRQIRKAR